MLFLNKLLPVFVLPLGLVVLLLVWAILRKKRWPVIAALVLLYVCSMPIVGSTLSRQLEKRYPAISLEQVEKTDALVSLGGFLGPTVAEGYLPNLAEAGERLEAGIELWQRKKADWLVFTGGRVPWAKQSETEGERGMRVAMARGIPGEKILVTREVGNTADEAHAIRDLMRERGWQRITLLTSANHMPRAARLFRGAGVDFLPFPVDFQIDPSAHWTLLDFLPRAEGLKNTELALRELLGIAFYAVTGG